MNPTDGPLKTTWLQLLLAIAEGNRHGYAIRKAIEDRTAGRVRLWPTTLYGALRSMVEEGLLREDEDDGQADDKRQRRCYDLTERGRRALEMETRRLEELVRAARSTPALRTARPE